MTRTRASGKPVGSHHTGAELQQASVKQRNAILDRFDRDGPRLVCSAHTLSDVPDCRLAPIALAWAYRNMPTGPIEMRCPNHHVTHWVWRSGKWSVRPGSVRDEWRDVEIRAMEAWDHLTDDERRKYIPVLWSQRPDIQYAPVNQAAREEYAAIRRYEAGYSGSAPDGGQV